MKILMYGDLHSNFDYPDYMGFLEETMLFLCGVIREEKPDVVVCMGDITDTFGTVDLQSMIWASQWNHTLSNQIRSQEAHHIILSGNHDVGDADATFSSVRLLGSDYSNIYYAQPHLFKTTTVEPMVIAPYGSQQQEVLTLLTNSGARFLFCHWDWMGCRFNSSFVSREGWDPAAFAASFPGVKVFCGHYHTPSQVGPVVFVGSPCFRDFRDFDGDVLRGFTIFDTETGALRRIANPNTYYLRTIKVEDKRNLIEQVDQIPNKPRVKIKMFVPRALMEDAQRLRQGFLWSQVYQTDSDSPDQLKHTSISVTASSQEVVAMGLKAAPPGYDTKRLEEMGREAFKA